MLVATVSLVFVRRHPTSTASNPLQPAAPDSPLRRDDLTVETRLVPIPEGLLPVQSWGGPRRWRLPHYTRVQSLELLDGLRGAADSLACDAAGCTVEPALDAVAELGPAARSRIYSVLVTIEHNPQGDNTFYRNPERGPFSAVADLPPDARPLVDRLTWTRQGVPAFSDIAVVCNRLGPPAECQRFMRAMLTRPSASVSIRLDERGAIEHAENAFGPDRREAVRAQLDSALAAGVRDFPLESLLPPWARSRLATFPLPGEEWTNCFWTALRFLDRADDRVDSGAVMDDHLRREFARVTSTAEFGDVVVLRDETDAAVHAAVWLLGGYLYQKNGTGRLQAWRIVPWAEATSEYPGARAELWRPRAPR